jgi:hypothetical protein
MDHSKFLVELLQHLYGDGWEHLTIHESNKIRARHAALVEAAEWTVKYMHHFITLDEQIPYDPEDPDLTGSEPFESYKKLKAALAEVKE